MVVIAVVKSQDTKGRKRSYIDSVLRRLDINLNAIDGHAKAANKITTEPHIVVSRNDLTAEERMGKDLLDGSDLRWSRGHTHTS